MPGIHRFSENVYAATSFVVNMAVPGAVGAAGAAVDTVTAGLAGPHRRAAALIHVTTGGSATTFDCKLQESILNTGTWVDVTSGAFTQVAASATGSIQLMDIDLAKRYRYLRLYYTIGGGAVGYAAGAIFLFQGANEAATQSITAVHV